MKRHMFLFLIGTLFPLEAIPYEWKSHNSMANQARRLAIQCSADSELVAFLQVLDPKTKVGFGLDLDTRAGDEHDDAFTDEDHNEGYLREIFTCTYQERDCWHAGFYVRSSLWVAPCTLDHFFPRLPLPIPNQDAPVHARYYFDMAVKLYKAAKCDRWGLRDTYMRGAARALGHAIHLVEDMGVPQHVRPENHAPFPIGLGPSFHEYWVLDGWDVPATYTRPDGSGNAVVATFVQGAANAAAPRRGHLEGIMGSLAAKSRQFLSGSPYEPGSRVSIKELGRVMAGSNVTLDWVESKGREGEHLAWTLPHIRTNGFAIYGRGRPHDKRHTFSLFGHSSSADYRAGGTMARPAVALESPLKLSTAIPNTTSNEDRTVSGEWT